MKTPVLTTERLLLRPLEERDAQAVFEWESDPAVEEYMFWESHTDIAKTCAWIAEEQAKINAPDWFRWGIECVESHALIGTGLVYFDEDLRSYEIGYNLARAYWGKGYATEAMRAIVRFAGTQLGVNTLTGQCAAENPASARVMEKLGFAFVGERPYPCREGQTPLKGLVYRLEG